MKSDNTKKTTYRVVVSLQSDNPNYIRQVISEFAPRARGVTVKDFSSDVFGVSDGFAGQISYLYDARGQGYARHRALESLDRPLKRAEDRVKVTNVMVHANGAPVEDKPRNWKRRVAVDVTTRSMGSGQVTYRIEENEARTLIALYRELDKGVRDSVVALFPNGTGCQLRQLIATFLNKPGGLNSIIRGSDSLGRFVEIDTRTSCVPVDAQMLDHLPATGTGTGTGAA